jgi:hypothetical protein
MVPDHLMEHQQKKRLPFSLGIDPSRDFHSFHLPAFNWNTIGLPSRSDRKDYNDPSQTMFIPPYPIFSKTLFFSYSAAHVDLADPKGKIALNGKSAITRYPVCRNNRGE